MPIWLRRFTFNKIKEYYQDEKDAHENKSTGGNTKTVIDSNGKIQAPELLQKTHSNKKPVKYQ